MQLKDVFKQIKFQTLVGWTVGYLAAIVLNALVGGQFDGKFWLSIGGVLIVRVVSDLLFALKDARQEQK